jgi:hypothetical protein
MKAMEKDRHNKIVMRILKGIQNTQKQITIKSIPAYVRLEGNERADILAKDGALQLKDAHRILEQTQRKERSNWYVLKAAEKGKEEDMGIQHILYICMKFTRRRLTCDCLEKQILLKAIYEKGDTATWDEIIKYLKDIKMERSKIN